MASLNYVLITPARNEARNIAKTIRSVMSQTVPPLRWVIVSDASTDGTDDIIRELTSGIEWIELLRMPERRERSFAAKVACFDAGRAALRTDDYAFIGNVDADISFGPDHFEFLLSKFAETPRLGVAGTLMREESYDPLKDSVFDDRDVFGACQLFRRECFEAIGGYLPIKGGGVDWLAVKMARMKGWQTRSFLDKVFHHHHPMGTGDKGVLFARYDYGRKDYRFGNHPLWELGRVLFQATRKPYLVGGLLLLCGYAGSMIRRVRRPIPREVVAYHRKEQMQRLAGMLKKALGLRGAREKREG